jgi:ABC-type branched-subunit amino acid transport system substrate-binding protein
VIFITEKGARQSDVQTQMQAAIDSSGVAYRNFSYSILEGRDVMDPLMALMTKTGQNRVVIASESEAFVNDVVRNLNLIEYQKCEVVLYSPSKNRNFETIDVDNIHNTSLHTSLSYYINYDDPKVKNFLLKYRAMFNTEPTQFAFQGYDLATYFIDLVSRYGEKWSEMMPENEKKMLQSTFRFRKAGNDEGGYINNGVRRISYEEGWKVKEQD